MHLTRKFEQYAFERHSENHSFIPYFVSCLISILLFILQDIMQQQRVLNGFKCMGAWPEEVTRRLN